MSINDLQLDDFLPSSGRIEEMRLEHRSVLLREALALGASEVELWAIVNEFDRQNMVPSAGQPAWRHLSDQRTVPDQVVADQIVGATMSFDMMIETEFNSLSDAARASFKPGGEYPSAQAKYRAFWVKMYRLGYNRPFETIFGAIHEGRFLGQDIDGGIHDTFAAVLAAVEQNLDSGAPGTAAKIGRGLSSVLGVQMRMIDGSPNLSNHAFGLAVDLDPRYNPNVKLDFVNVVREITGTDFGRSFAAASLPNDAEVTQAYAIESKASDLFKAWLTKWIPPYEENKAQQAAIAAAAKGNTPAPAFPAPADDPATRQRNFALIDRLLRLRETTMQSLKGWATHGIITIPLQVAVAFAKAGANWGSQYPDRKDTMHFEIFASKALPPDVPPRRLDDLKHAVPIDAMGEVHRLISDKHIRHLGAKASGRHGKTSRHAH